MSEFALMVVNKGQSPHAGATIVEFRQKCPICETTWLFHGTLQKKEKLRDAIGQPVMVNMGNALVRATRVSTMRWGAHSLCGKCSAKRAARIIEEIMQGGRKYRLSIPWKEQDEKDMYGRLMHQQDRYHGWASIVGEWTPESILVDQQREERKRIMATNPIYIARSRVERLGLDWKEDL